MATPSSTLMDAAAQRKGCEAVTRRLARKLSPLGYARTMPTFFTRRGEHVVEFVHLHRQRGTPDFQVHCGVRVLNDPFEAIALNGLRSQGHDGAPRGKKYFFRYQQAEEAQQRCAQNLFEFCQEVAEPWLLCWRAPLLLLSAPDSPLEAQARSALQKSLQGEAEPHLIEQTCKLLGLR